MRKWYILISVQVLTTSLSAQSFEEQFRSFQQQAEQSYTDFRDAANLHYLEFLRNAWDYYLQAPAIPRPHEQEVPPVVYDDRQQQEEQIPVEITPIPQPSPAPAPIAPIEENATPQSAISVTYNGTVFSFRCPESKLALPSLTGEAIAQAWQTLAASEYDNLVYDCLHNRDAYHLCDWAYIELTYTLALQLYGPSNEATLLHAFILAQSGYAMRLAQSRQGQLYVLVGSHYQIYDIGYFSIDNLYFYPLLDIQEGLEICSGSFEQEQPFSLYIDPEQNLSVQQEQIASRRSEQGIDASCTINLNTISFYNSYPTGQVGGDCGSRWATYANAPMEECVRQSLYPTLMQAIRGVPEAQAVNRLLNWVQTAFEYEYDDKVWGHDRAFFPSETLHYPYADCEDRAILFSRIVRDLLGLDVVLLYYPGHLATAVAFHQSVRGDYVVYHSTRYTVCDPTYIGAPIGCTMPDMDNQTAKIIPLTR